MNNIIQIQYNIQNMHTLERISSIETSYIAMKIDLKLNERLKVGKIKKYI